MAAKPDLRDIGRLRRQDIIILASGGLILVFALTATGALGLLEGLSSAMLVGGGAVAYHIGVLANARAAKPAQELVSKRSSANAVKRVQQDLVDALDQPALVVDAGAQLVAYNSMAAGIFSLPAVRAGLSVGSLRNPELLAHVDRVLGAGGSAACELVPSREPSQTWLVTVSALGDDTRGERSALIVLTDQAPVRRAERARADFLANASHELRTPLTSISGFIETMQGPAIDDPDAWPRFLKIIADQTKHMKDLITDLLSLSRIELGEHQAPTTKVDFLQIAKEASESLEHIAKKKSQQISFETSETSLVVIASESELKQVVHNLAGNAIKYAPEGTTITVSIGRSRDLDAAEAFASRGWSGASRATLLAAPETIGGVSKAAAWLRVRNQGPGIDSAYLPRLGERFYRVNESRGGPDEGTGLGLAIVKHIMAHHRGGFAVESTTEDGTAFSVWLPALDEQKGES
ncbi:MAG: ATP-binding protein [Pseudomonadota bacterium]